MRRIEVHRHELLSTVIDCDRPKERSDVDGKPNIEGLFFR